MAAISVGIPSYAYREELQGGLRLRGCCAPRTIRSAQDDGYECYCNRWS
jgi:hypothetical protein